MTRATSWPKCRRAAGWSACRSNKAQATASGQVATKSEPNDTPERATRTAPSKPQPSPVV
jgi:hypothetical protein